MVIVSSDLKPQCYAAFDATVFLLYHTTTKLQKGYQATVHIGSICRTAVLESIYNEKVIYH